ncbi:MAG: 50S ribosomal protein L17, partial [Saprospiraceae bacterium]|nr:50S ribosomal protein L17 [Saprospiraceae bacterium]MCF8252840.1 50S ribosomal protein L17 [Saprospiraceae bacterium]MCF8314389.1 50S ribosomal protein L17 [Saprospiraceae bacterium]MCF8443273.1 50S ribosomal protein L17 [Saprospiraceae bacterium]
TLQKAKALRVYFEPLVTRAKDNSTHNRRIVFGHLQNKEALKELFGPIAEAVGERPGGYVRIIRTGYRHGDAADMAMIELVDFNTDYNGQSKVEEGKGKKRRTRRSGGSKSSAATAAPVAAVAAPAAVVQEEVEDVVEDVVETTEEVVADAAEIASPETEATQDDAPAAEAEEEK